MRTLSETRQIFIVIATVLVSTTTITTGHLAVLKPMRWLGGGETGRRH